MTRETNSYQDIRKKSEIFSGFDLASYRKLYPSENYRAIVVNALANLSTPYIEEINSLALNLKHAVDLYLDNDPAGDEKTKLAEQLIKNAEDGQGLYQDFQDLNDYLVSGMVRKLGR